MANLLTCAFKNATWLTRDSGKEWKEKCAYYPFQMLLITVAIAKGIVKVIKSYFIVHSKWCSCNVHMNVLQKILIRNNSFKMTGRAYKRLIHALK